MVNPIVISNSFQVNHRPKHDQRVQYGMVKEWFMKYSHAPGIQSKLIYKGPENG